MTASTPHSTAASRSSGAFTVQVMTATPPSCARPTRSPVDLGVVRVESHTSELGGRLECRRRVEGGMDEQRQCHATRGRGHGGQGVGPERRHHDGRWPRPPRGDGPTEDGGDVERHLMGRVVAGVGRDVLDLHVDDRSGARRQGQLEGRYPRRELVASALVDEPRARDGRVVVHDEGPVRAAAHIELHAVGAGPQGRLEGLDRVLDPGPGPPAVREHRDGGSASSVRPPLVGHGDTGPGSSESLLTATDHRTTSAQRRGRGEREVWREEGWPSAWAARAADTARERCPCLAIPTRNGRPAKELGFWGNRNSAWPPTRTLRPGTPGA